MAKVVAIFAALDTKGDEARLIREVLVDQGVTPLVVDIGVLDQPRLPADVSREQVAADGGATLRELVASRDKSRAMDVMTAGAAVVAARLFAEGRLDGVIGLGGSAGTGIATSAMRALPIGVPKLCVSTVAAGETRPYVGTKDVTLMYSVVDVAGINRISARILTNAAAAIAGMVQVEPPAIAERPLLAASMFGNTTRCVDRARARLEAADYEVLVFHATGTGGQTMESLVGDGFIAGVLDVTTTEWADELVGGVFSAGPHRLEAAARAGIPQVVAPGCLDMVNFGAPETVPQTFRGRTLYRWNPNVTLLRTNVAENAELGRIIAEKISQSVGPVAVMLPLKGVSQLDGEGEAFWWPDADGALFGAIKQNLRRDIPVYELNHNINDPEFADAAAETLLGLMRRR